MERELQRIRLVVLHGLMTWALGLGLAPYSREHVAFGVALQGEYEGRLRPRELAQLPWHCVAIPRDSGTDLIRIAGVVVTPFQHWGHFGRPQSIYVDEEATVTRLQWFVRYPPRGFPLSPGPWTPGGVPDGGGDDPQNANCPAAAPSDSSRSWARPPSRLGTESSPSPTN